MKNIFISGFCTLLFVANAYADGFICKKSPSQPFNEDLKIETFNDGYKSQFGDILDELRDLKCSLTPSGFIFHCVGPIDAEGNSVLVESKIVKTRSLEAASQGQIISKITKEVHFYRRKVDKDGETVLGDFEKTRYAYDLSLCRLL